MEYTREERVLIELQRRKHYKSIFGTVAMDDESLLIRALADQIEEAEISKKEPSNEV